MQDLKWQHFGSESDQNALDNTSRTLDQLNAQQENWRKFNIFNTNEERKQISDKRCSLKEESNLESWSRASRYSNSESRNEADITAQPRFLWLSEDEGKPHQDSIEKNIDVSKQNCNYMSEEFEAQGLNGSLYETKWEKLKMINQIERRERTYSDADRPPKRAFDLSQISSTHRNWEENFNFSMNAELGEACENKIEEAENEDEQQIKDDSDYFYSGKDVRKSIKRPSEFMSMLFISTMQRTLQIV